MWVLFLVLVGALVSLGYGVSLGAGPIKPHYFYAYQNGGKDSGHAAPPPSIRVFLKNFAGDVIREMGNEGEGDSDAHFIVTLPKLKVEDHIWEGMSIVLECSSEHYPLMWDYHGVGQPKVQVSSYRRAPDYYNLSSYSYGASVTFPRTDYRGTGEYSCLGTGQRSDSYSSLFAFIPGNDDNLFVANDGLNETLTVHANEDNPWVTFPCVVSVKTAVVKLYIHSANGRLEEVKEGEGVTGFEPTEGFRLKWKGMRNPWREYVCRGEYQTSEGIKKLDKLHLRLKPPIRHSALSISNINSPESNSVKFEYNERSGVVHCCSADSVRQPQMKLRSCTSISDCFVARRVLGRIEGDGGGNFCPGTKCDDTAFIKVNDTCVGYELLEMDHSGILQCKLLNESDLSILQFSYGVETGLVTDFSVDGKETSKILTIGREETLNRNESMTSKGVYFCNPNPFFFSHGIKWAFVRGDEPNAPLQFLPELSFPGRPSIEVDESSDVREVYCFAPLWDSPTQWRNVSLKVPH